MNSLPALDSASFDAHLPFAVEPLPDGQCPSRLERQTRLALQVMAAPTETPEDANPLLQRLEAKIDLALEMALLSQHPERPPLTHCRLGLNAIALAKPGAVSGWQLCAGFALPQSGFGAVAVSGRPHPELQAEWRGRLSAQCQP
ncbi:hypothetical protein [Paludibacterium denitrificans]|uniref:hypothetical protein n=1 Tax=Paludibacterium denitrificans TaxID=2675226 RepID=UPI001E4DD708|nr:hypothetical protein [Paludibacterium denitrificans]